DGSEGAARRDGLARLAEDEWIARDARERSDRAKVDVHRGASRRAGVVAGDRASRAEDRDIEMVEGGAPRRLPRLQPERKGSHHLLGLLGATVAGRASLGAALVGGGAGLRA